MVKAVDTVLTRTGFWKRGQFKEAVNELWNSGFQVVEGEVADFNHLGSPRTMQSSGQTIYNSSLLFFNEIERQLRTSAYFIAFREFRSKNPTKTITNVERHQILDRAKLLTADMTREHNSAWQRGAFSPMTQFFSYHSRVLGQMMGKRLTRQEKIQAVLGYSFAYGLPIGLSLGAAPIPLIGYSQVLPMREITRKEFLKRGWNPDAKGVDFMMNGFMQTAFNWIGSEVTGDEDFEMAVSDRYATDGIQIIYDIIADPSTTTNLDTLTDIFGGASVSIGKDLLRDVRPIARATWGWLTRGEYPAATDDDWKYALDEISTFNSLSRLHAAWNGQVFMTRTGMEIPMSRVEAVL